jgi:hypothetical protein
MLTENNFLKGGFGLDVRADFYVWFFTGSMS